MSHLSASISQQALHTFKGNAFLQELQWSMDTNADPLHWEQIANDIVHPVTNKTSTKYRKIDDPLLRETWMGVITALNEQVHMYHGRRWYVLLQHCH